MCAVYSETSILGEITALPDQLLRYDSELPITISRNKNLALTDGHLRQARVRLSEALLLDV